MTRNRIIPWIACFGLIHTVHGEELQEKPDNQNRAPDAPAFLGVATAAMPAILSDHLSLKPDGGVVVESLGNNSPAQLAGIKIHDVITAVDGKPVKSPMDLGREIRNHKPGEKISINLIQQGKANTLDVVLAPREEIPIPQEQEQNLNAAGVQKLKNRLQDLKQRLEGMQLPNAVAPAPMGGVRIQGGGELRLADPNGTVGFKSDQNGTEITVRDNNNKIVWSGPWDTPQDKAAAPDSIRARIEQFNILPTHDGNGLQLQMGNVPPPLDAPEDDAAADENDP